jgi:hypothetical protein
MLMHQKVFDLLFAALALWNPACRSQCKGRNTPERRRGGPSSRARPAPPGSSQSPRSQR